MESGSTSAEHERHVRCWGCNYILHGLQSRRCPECGREFDPDRPGTVNARRAIGSAGRAVMRRTWWITVALAAAATGAIAFATRWPAVWAGFSLVDVRFYAPLRGFPRVLDLQTPADVGYSAALYLWLIVGAWWLIWLVPRMLMRRRLCPPADLWPTGGRRDLAIAAMLLASALMATLGWPRRLAQHTYSGRKTMVWHWFGAAPAAPQLGPSQRLAVIKAGLLQLPREGRIAAIQAAVNAKADGLPLLLKAVGREKDRKLRVAEVYIIALYRDPQTVDLLLGLLSDKDSEMRTAAADALGIVHAPAYRIPQGSPFTYPASPTLAANRDSIVSAD